MFQKAPVEPLTLTTHHCDASDVSPTSCKDHKINPTNVAIMIGFTNIFLRIGLMVAQLNVFLPSSVASLLLPQIA